MALYLADMETWERAVARMDDHGYSPVCSGNPYWDRHGITYEDADGYRVVLQNADRLLKY